jgi:hypothetical protein
MRKIMFITDIPVEDDNGDVLWEIWDSYSYECLASGFHSREEAQKDLDENYHRYHTRERWGWFDNRMKDGRKIRHHVKGAVPQWRTPKWGLGMYVSKVKPKKVDVYMKATRVNNLR